MIEENKDYPIIELNKDCSIIPDEPGIYMYINEDGGLYIGKSINLRNRYKQHKNAINHDENNIDYQLRYLPNKFTYRILIYGVDPTILNSLESMYINRYNAVSDGYNYQNNNNLLGNSDNKKLVTLFNNLRKQYIDLLDKYNKLKEKYNLLQNKKR